MSDEKPSPGRARRGSKMRRRLSGLLALGVALVPGILAADVDEDESLTGLLCGVDVGGVRFVVEFH